MDSVIKITGRVLGDLLTKYSDVKVDYGFIDCTDWIKYDEVEDTYYIDDRSKTEACVEYGTLYAYSCREEEFDDERQCFTFRVSPRILRDAVFCNTKNVFKINNFKARCGDGYAEFTGYLIDNRKMLNSADPNKKSCRTGIYFEDFDEHDIYGEHPTNDVGMLDPKFSEALLEKFYELEKSVPGKGITISVGSEGEGDYRTLPRLITKSDVDGKYREDLIKEYPYLFTKNGNSKCVHVSITDTVVKERVLEMIAESKQELNVGGELGLSLSIMWNFPRKKYNDTETWVSLSGFTYNKLKNTISTSMSFVISNNIHNERSSKLANDIINYINGEIGYSSLDKAEPPTKSAIKDTLAQVKGMLSGKAERPKNDKELVSEFNRKSHYRVGQNGKKYKVKGAIVHKSKKG